MFMMDVNQLRLAIPLLNDAQFVAMCNSLLSEIAASRHVREYLRLNLNIKEPDGGIDAACRASTATVGRLIPKANTDYQFKSGAEKKSVPQLVQKDILGKRRVMEGLTSGGAFVYMAGWDRGDRMEERIVEELARRDVKVSAGQVSFVGREDLAQLLMPHPGIAAGIVGVDATNPLWNFELWAMDGRMSNPYVLDEALRLQIDDMVKRVLEPGSTTRIVGAAGNGKTRLALEAVRRAELDQSVLYASQADAVTASLIRYLLHTEDIRCTLVVDEADDAAVQDIEQRLNSRPDGVRLVLIGLDATGRPQPDTMQVDGLSEDSLVKLIKAIAAHIPDDAAKIIARDCEKSPKLAYLVAHSIRSNPALLPTTVLTDRQLQTLLDRYLRIVPESDEWKALATISLLTRVGWLGDVESESTLLFDLQGLSPSSSRAHVVRLHDRLGIAPLSGRYRYVSPAMLANHLAASELRHWTRDHMGTLFGALTPGMTDSFAQRARRLSAVLENRKLVEEVILGDQGPFRSLEELEANNSVKILRRVASSFRDAGLRILRHLIENASIEELRASRRSRRDLVWTLEELLWPADSFSTAARLLLRLAVSENESWANNATNTFIETFQTFLGRTSAGWRARVEVLNEAATSEFVEARVLCARAIEVAFRTNHVHRVGMPPTDVPDMPGEEWRPKTSGEWADSLVAYLEILRRLLHDVSAEVQSASANALGQSATSIPTLGPRVATEWAAVANELQDASFELRTQVLERLEWMSERWSHHEEEIDAPDDVEERGATARIRDTLTLIEGVRRNLAGSDFSSRFRHAVSRAFDWASRSTRTEEEIEVARSEFEPFVREILSDPPLLDHEWEWLLANRAWPVSERFIELLGARDRQRVFAGTIETLSHVNPRGIVWLSLYELSAAGASDDRERVDHRARELVESKEIDQALDLLFRAGYSPTRLEMLLDLFERKQAKPERLNEFIYGPSWSAISAEQARDLYRAAARHATRLAELTPFISRYTLQRPGAAEVLRSEAFEVLADACEKPLLPQVDGYTWASLADEFVMSEPIRVGELALRQVQMRETSFDESLITLVNKAWNVAPKEVFFDSVVAPWLDMEYVPSHWVRQMLGRVPIAQLGPDFLLSWVSNDPHRRAVPLAEVIGAPYGAPSELHVELLSRFADYGVGSAYTSDFLSGTFTGSYTLWARGKLETVKAWASHSNRALSGWARGLVAGLEEDVNRSEMRDAEERFEL